MVPPGPSTPAMNPRPSGIGGSKWSSPQIGGTRYAVKTVGSLIGNDQPALWVEAHADPGTLAARDAIEQLDAKVFLDLDLIDLRRLRRAAVIGGRLVAAGLAGLGRGRSGEKEKKTKSEKGVKRWFGAHCSK